MSIDSRRQATSTASITLLRRFDDLFVMTFLLNFFSDRLVNRVREVY
jgi:hypothetical protein